MSRLEEKTCHRQEGFAIYDRMEIHSAGIYVLAGTKCQFNTLLDPLGPLLWGHGTKALSTEAIFLHYGDLTSFCPWKRRKDPPPLRLAPRYRGLLDPRCGFDVMFPVPTLVFLPMNITDIQIVHPECQRCKIRKTNWSALFGVAVSEYFKAGLPRFRVMKKKKSYFPATDVIVEHSSPTARCSAGELRA